MSAREKCLQSVFNAYSWSLCPGSTRCLCGSTPQDRECLDMSDLGALCGDISSSPVILTQRFS